MAVAIVAHCRRLNGARNCVKGKQFGDRNTAHKRNHGESPNNTSCEIQTLTCAYEGSKDQDIKRRDIFHGSRTGRRLDDVVKRRAGDRLGQPRARRTGRKSGTSRLESASPLRWGTGDWISWRAILRTSHVDSAEHGG